ncbi:hypothetical protein [Serratia liquefaciens]|uniref:hypothetical protein n=1 Tax=Serratia liquefaciens TaxID=614 RepID=UPI00218274FB|nr:hypothetical protein [Serratia liquefaciens]CAI2503838.1 Uncharacterised protein [Serratia liquefaciens]
MSIATNRSTLYRMAMKRFGPDSQLLKLAEEASELSTEVSRNLNGLSDEMKLASEMADVEIMIEQFRLNGLSTAIDFHKQQKLTRLAERLGVSYDPQ